MMAAALLLQAAAPSAAQTPCRWEEHRGDATIVHFGPARDCVSWQAPRRHVGIWIFSFEWSEFVEGATTIDDAFRAPPSDPRAAWVVQDARSGLPPGCRPVLGQAYRIDFDGRDVVPPAVRWPLGGGFGHMGMWRNEVLIDHVRSISLAGPLPGDQVRPMGVVARCAS